MDAERKKALRAEVRERQRAAARGAFPVSVDALEALFEALERSLSSHECDHTRRLTIEWLEAQELPVQRVCDWLETQGGFCDCEVLANVEQHVEDAVTGTSSAGPP